MKRSVLIMATGILLCTACILQLIYIQEEPFRFKEAPQPLPVETKRQSITFILGEDKEVNNPYYREAAKYYSAHPQGRTDYLVGTCRSLLEVRNYLEQYPPCDGQPWGLINLVSHGNQWVGMSVRVSPRSRRSTPEHINEQVKQGAFAPLPEHLIDGASEIFLHGCGLGNNPELIHAIARAFGTSNHQPVVRASRLFEYYTTVRDNGNAYTQRFMANAWFISYPMGKKPADQTLSYALREKYAHAAVDWTDALSRTQPRWTGDHYYYTFEVPLKLVVPQEHELPLPGTPSGALDWVARQSRVMEAVVKTGIPAEHFTWTFMRVYTDNEDGTRTPGVLVKGYATLLTVVQALTLEAEEGGVRAFQPDVADLEYYYFSSI